MSSRRYGSRGIGDLIPASGEGRALVEVKGQIGRSKGTMKPRYSSRSTPRVPTATVPWTGYATIQSQSIPNAGTASLNRLDILPDTQVVGSGAGIRTRTQVLRTSGSIFFSHTCDTPISWQLWMALEPLDDDQNPFNVGDLSIADVDFMNRRGIFLKRFGVLGAASTAAGFSDSQSYTTQRLSLKGGTLGSDRQLSLFLRFERLVGTGSATFYYQHFLASRITA